MKREVITNNVFKVKNENGESVECTVLFTFSSTETNKDYIVYTDNSKNDLGEINVYANTFDKTGSSKVLNKIETEEEWNTTIDSFVVLQPTSPLRISEDIDGAVQLFNDRKADSVVTYVKEAHPVFWHKKIDENNKLEDLFEGTIANRQELPTTYYPNGAVYVFSTAMIRQRKYYTDKSYAYIMPRERSVDIDFLDDFKYAEFLMQSRNMK